MGRPPLPVGTIGRIRFEVLGRHRVQAGAGSWSWPGSCPQSSEVTPRAVAHPEVAGFLQLRRHRYLAGAVNAPLTWSLLPRLDSNQ